MARETKTPLGIKDSTCKQLQYRPSASLIIAAKNTVGVKNKFNYQVLMIKRTLRTAYAPDHCVFPGGAFEATADENAAWLEYFSACGITATQLEQLKPKCDAKRPAPLMTSGINFSRDISLRITALRETFEEVGVLLCQTSNTSKEQRLFGHVNENFDRIYWQRAVHEDPNKFLQLCKILNVIPDLWSLHEWSIWRSPVTSAKRFDTVFYFVSLEEQPKLLLEESEVAAELWHTPAMFLQLFTERSIWLPPPQYYELSRLTHAHELLQLVSFLKQRQTEGSTLLQPVYYRCKDGMVGAMPGDDFYPTQSSDFPKEFIILDCSLAEFRKLARNFHRFTYCDMYNFKVETNIPVIDMHLNPVLEDSLDSKL